jgi:hypothetical protein
MKITELRIGNWVEQTEHKESGMPFKKHIQFSESNWYRMGDCVEYEEDFEPITLTEEWLVKFGWVWNKETNSYEKYPNGDARMHLEYRPLNGSYKMFNYVLKALICERIWYVHQLQNLFFALAGEELLITNNKTNKQ